MKVVILVVILVWFFGALYFGSGGVTSLELAQEKGHVTGMVVDAKDTAAVFYDNIEFQNISAANIYKADKAYEEKWALAVKIFPWLNLPYNFLGLIITALAFGALGGTIALLKEIAIDKLRVEDVKFFSKPLLGAGCGVIILSMSYLLPVLIVTGETEVRSFSIVFAGLFGGLFSERFFEWLSSVFGKIFKN